eukprot:4528052-Pyramimonas_sp.AAC.1
MGGLRTLLDCWRRGRSAGTFDARRPVARAVAFRASPQRLPRPQEDISRAHGHCTADGKVPERVHTQPGQALGWSLIHI